MTRADVILLLLSLLAAAVLAVCIAVGRREGTTLLLTCNGKAVCRSSLPESGRGETEAAPSEKVRYCLLLYTETGASCEWYETKPDLSPIVSEKISYNLLAVSASGVSMEAADCPDQICVHHIPISGDRENIICLPHKLVAEIRAGGEHFPGDSASEGRQP